MRFKKLRNNKASCIHTQQALKFFSQVEIPGIPNPERLVVGYQLNNIQTEIKAISIIYPKAPNQNYWTYDLKPTIAMVSASQQVEFDRESATQKERITIKGETAKVAVKNE